MPGSRSSQIMRNATPTAMVKKTATTVSARPVDVGSRTITEEACASVSFVARFTVDQEQSPSIVARNLRPCARRGVPRLEAPFDEHQPYLRKMRPFASRGQPVEHLPLPRIE